MENRPDAPHAAPPSALGPLPALPAGTAVAEQHARPRLTAAVLVALWTLTGAGYGCLLPFLAVYAARRGLGLAEIGLVSAAGAVLAALLQPVAGRLLDRTGHRRAILAVATVMAAAGFAGLGYAAALPPIAACAALGIAGRGAARVVITAVTVNAVEGSTRGTAMYARFRVCPAIGYTLAAVGGGLLLNYAPFALVFTIGAGFFLMTGLCGLALPAPAPHVERPASAQERPHPVMPARRALGTLALMSLLYYVISSSADTYAPLLMRHLHGSLTEVALTGTISAVVEIPLMILCGALADRVRRALLLVGGMAALPLRFALYFLVHTPLQLLAVQVLDGLTFSVYAIVGVALLVEQTPREERAWALSVYSGAGTLGPIAGPPAAGVLAGHVGLQPMFGLFALGAVVVPLTVAGGLWPLLRTPPAARD